jgi:hypothetical protein
MEEQYKQALLEEIKRVQTSAKRMIFITFQKEGIHKYPAALTDPELEDVSFLGHPHRHMFHFNVSIEVVHNDRDIEFIQFKRWLESLYADGVLELDFQSCEMMCDALHQKIGETYPSRDIHITISEDGENGATIEYNQFRPTQTIKI